ncbi:MAG: hypothetical protein SF070_10015 [Gemmatimonadota bacterium]|nr:hypothetical protein [Gemmatimonadota bacterium]
MISSSEAVGRRGIVMLAAAALLGCAPESDPLDVEPVAQPLEVGVAVSRREAGPGDTVAVLPLVRRTDGGPLAGVQGVLRFDSRALRYLGQPLAGDAFVLVNHAAASDGRLRLASLRLAGLAAGTGDLRFEVLQPGWMSGLGYELEEAVTPEGVPLYRAAGLPLAEAPVPVARDVRPRTLEDWWDYFGLVEQRRANLAGQGTIFGDVTLNAAIDVLDASAVANLAVGNRALLTEVNRDYVIAGDVAPANLPGLGEASDPIPPGRNADGSFDITVLDAVEIANEAVGNDRVIPGQPVPGRGPRPGSAVLSGLLASSRTLFRDTVYELQGNVIVGPGATLTVQPGTLIEGDGATRGTLIVARAGNVDMRGTRIEPIVLTCKGPVKSAGCWGGVVLNGLAILNHRDPGTTGFCPEKFSPGSTELYGGCLVEDTTGVLQYVRIEHAGMSYGSGPTAGLSLLGTGSGTVLDQVQVHGSLGDGLYLSGGNVNLRHVLLTGNLGAGLHWDHGWGGNAFGGSAQFLQVQVPVNGGDAILGSNLVGLPNAGPRSEPELYNVTLVGSGSGAGRGFVLQDGSGGILRNAIILGMAADGLDIEGAESCAQFGAGFAFFDHNIAFGNSPDYSADADCFDENGYATTPVLLNREVDPALVAPANTLTPDTRPLVGSPATSGAVAPPSNFFFDVTVTYLGAAEPANASRTNVPWYAGWSRGWSGTAP